MVGMNTTAKNLGAKLCEILVFMENMKNFRWR